MWQCAASQPFLSDLVGLQRSAGGNGCGRSGEDDLYRTASGRLPELYHVGQVVREGICRETCAPVQLAGPEFQLVVDVKSSGIAGIHVGSIEEEVRKSVMGCADVQPDIVRHLRRFEGCPGSFLNHCGQFLSPTAGVDVSSGHDRLRHIPEKSLFDAFHPSAKVGYQQNREGIMTLEPCRQMLDGDGAEHCIRTRAGVFLETCDLFLAALESECFLR